LNQIYPDVKLNIIINAIKKFDEWEAPYFLTGEGLWGRIPYESRILKEGII